MEFQSNDAMLFGIVITSSWKYTVLCCADAMVQFKKTAATSKGMKEPNRLFPRVIFFMTILIKFV
jgi:hypothetical protein